MSQEARQAGRYPIFCSMKGQGVFRLPPRWDAVKSQGSTPGSLLKHKSTSCAQDFIQLFLLRFSFVSLIRY